MKRRKVQPLVVQDDDGDKDNFIGEINLDDDDFVSPDPVKQSSQKKSSQSESKKIPVPPLPVITQTNANINPKVPPSNRIAVDVKIDGKTLRVPMLKENTITELSVETARRYMATGSCTRKPNLVLKTNEGSELFGEDRIDSLPESENAVISLVAVVANWSTDSIDKLYEELCAKADAVRLEDVSEKVVITKTSGILDLTQVGLLGNFQNVTLALNAARHQGIIKELRLAKCRIGSSQETVKALCEVVGTLPHLTTLDLSNNVLTAKHVEDLVTSITAESNTGKLDRLNHLDLSFNFLRDDVDSAMVSLLEEIPYLTNLSLKSCQLTSRFFTRKKSRWKEILKSLVKLDLSYNRMGVTGLKITLSCLNPTALKQLNVSGTISESEPKEVSAILEEYAFRDDAVLLEKLFMSRCKVSQHSIPSIFRGVIVL